MNGLFRLMYVSERHRHDTRYQNAISASVLLVCERRVQEWESWGNCDKSDKTDLKGMRQQWIAV